LFNYLSSTYLSSYPKYNIMSKGKKYHAIGLMSGSSLDGIDLALTTFEVETQPKGELRVLHWEIEKSKTIPYPAQWVSDLQKAPEMSGLELSLLHSKLGNYFGQVVLEFSKETDSPIDYISSHGHTVFHYPQKKMTLQIGDGAAIAALTGIDVFDNFRLQDIAAGGEGAPLAPIVDAYLFPEIKYTLNLGGIANINIKTANGYLAYDLCGANQILNALSKEAGKEYDENGQIAAKGQIIPKLLRQANQWDYLRLAPPKSLDNRQVQNHTVRLFSSYPSPLEDRMFTAVHHIGYQIAASIHPHVGFVPEQLLITGGGALNTFLVSVIKEYLSPNIEIIKAPDSLINFKECVLMGLLGLLNIYQLPTTLPSVTGAKWKTVGGCFHRGSSKKPQ